MAAGARRGLSTTELDHRISFWRSSPIDDGTATVDGPPAEIGRRSAKRVDVKDGERMRANQQGQELTTRWTVRSDALTRSIVGGDFIKHRKATFAVIGTKEVTGRFVGIEITTAARPDIRP